MPRLRVYKVVREEGPRNCPLLKACKRRVTKKYFASVCNSASFGVCATYAKRRGSLLTPVNWLKKFAVKTEYAERAARDR